MEQIETMQQGEIKQQAAAQEAADISQGATRYQPAKSGATRYYRCRECGVRGAGGAHPFSTNPSSGYCDDCGA